MLLSAYFDASERTSGTFCVGGIAFPMDSATEAEADWVRIWGDMRCHMTDLHNRKGDFVGWEPAQGAERYKQCVDSIRQRAAYFVAASCNLSEVRRLAPSSCAEGREEFLAGFRRAYALCCHMSMSMLAELCRKSGDEGRIAYVFESGDKDLAECQRFIGTAVSHPELEAEYGHMSHTVMDKKDARLLEIADIAAWEWAFRIDRKEKKQSTRPPLLELLHSSSADRGGRPFCKNDRSHAIHFTGDALRVYYEKVKSQILA